MLLYILRRQIKKITDIDSDEDDIMIDDIQNYIEGTYAQDTINQILSSYRGSVVSGDDETFL